MQQRPNPLNWHNDVRGQSLKYFVTDSEDRVMPESEEIVYNFNSDGLRMDIEMDDVEQGCDIYIGDSSTFALGVNQEDGWAYKHNTKDQFVNMGQVGSGLDTVTRYLGYWVPILKPENVFLLEPAPNRQEFLDKDGIGESSAIWHQVAVQRMGGHEITDESRFKEKVFLERVALEPQIRITKERNLAAIQWICRDTNLLYSDHSPFEWYGGARDGFHPGAEQHDKILDRFVRVKIPSPLPSDW
jgi:hypothetical protein